MSQYLDIHTHCTDARAGVLSVFALMIGARAGIPPAGLFSAAIHPYDARRVEVSWFDTLANVARDERCVALGETGLDGRNEYSASIKQQTAVFAEHIFLSNKLSKPLIIHSVRALEPVLGMLEKANEPFVIHGFRGSISDAQRIIARGGYVSVGEKIVTDTALAARMAEIPMERILIETDDSRLDVRDIYESVAAIFRLQVEELKLIVQSNAERIFKINL